MIWSLDPAISDQHSWRLSKSGSYSSKSAYEAFFIGTIRFAPWKRISKSWAPLKCKFFIWLVLNNRCWMTDRLAKRGLPHPAACPLCDQVGETVQHVLMSCVFSRQVWAIIHQKLGLVSLSPQPSDTHFSSWWCKSINGLPKDPKKGLNSLIIMVAWELWKHRNFCVFEGGSPSIQLVLQNVRE